jgi:hypothetical protein
VIIDASNTPGNYWFKVSLSTVGLCGATKVASPQAIFRYAGQPNTLPTTTGASPVDTFCSDQNDWEPYHAVTIPASQFTLTQAVNDNLPVTLSLPPLANTVVWKVNASDIRVNWDYPVVDYVRNGSAFPRKDNVVVIDQANVWSFWVIQNLSPIPHP